MAIIGIDLGTTNSLAAVWKEDKSVLIPNVFGEYLTPSVVHIDQNGEIIVGKIAKEKLITEPENTMASFKRDMGTDKVYTLRNREFTPTDLSSFVLRKLKEDAEQYLQEEIEEAIISVPAYFNDNQRSATKLAGRLAGLKVERIINEPSAAALYTQMQNKQEECRYLVVDFGGGTLDISVVDIFDDVIEIVAVAGDNHLGGDDFDTLLMETFIEKNRLEIKKLTKQERQSIRKEAERTKIAFSKEKEVQMNAFIGGMERTLSITEKEFINLGKDLFIRMQEPIDKALQDSQFSLEEIDEVIMVGGSSHMPSVVNYVHYILKKEPKISANPDEVVALGVGTYAGIKERFEAVKDILITDICPFTLGVGIVDEYSDELKMSPVIERNSTLPVSREQMFNTIMPGQTRVKIFICQGEHRYVKDNTVLGIMEFNVPCSKDSIQYILVRFTYDINGILVVDAKICSTGEIINKCIVGKNTTMNEEEITARVKELEELKLHPRKRDKNRLILAKIERIFEENVGEIRKFADYLIDYYNAVLDTQDAKRIAWVNHRMEYILELFETEPANRVIFEVRKYMHDEGMVE